MRVLRGIWHFLSAAGNVSLVVTYGPVVAAVVVALAGRVLDQPTLFLVAIGIALLGLVVAGVNAWRQRPPKSKGGDAGALQFGAVEVGKPRPVHESNVFTDDWNGSPIVFNLINPQGADRARDVRPVVTVKDADGNVLAGPANARWANPQPPKTEEVERDIPANGAPVAIDTVIQEVGGDSFWLVTDEGLRTGLKANTEAITQPTFDVIVTVQGENVPPISRTVGVSLGFPQPVIRGADVAQIPLAVAAPPADPHALLADLYKEGEDLRAACAVPENSSFAMSVRWRLGGGGTPEEQSEREDKARAWDEKVAAYIWSEPSLKRFGPGWRPAGEPIKKATDHPVQSMFSTDRLAEWYGGKLNYLRTVIDRSAIPLDEPTAPVAPRQARPAGSPSLPDQIDSLMHEGMALVGELSVPAEPEQKPNGVWEISGGGAPAEWQEKANAFRGSAWELLKQGRPALLVDYRDACNAFLQAQQRATGDQDHSRDKRSTAKKMLDFATAQRSGPAMEVEACLEGLAAARHRL
jgi:hypothetical protein